MLVVFSYQENNSSSDLRTLGTLGPKGTFSDEAAQRYIERTKNKIKIIYYKTLSDCFKALKQKQVNRIIVPYMNSTIGYISETIQNLSGHDVLGYIEIPINLYLVSTGTSNKVTQIHSKKEVIQQCTKKLSRLNLRMVFEDSTSSAAKRIQGNPEMAAIVSKKALELNNFNILESNIQNSNYNRTNFIILE